MSSQLLSLMLEIPYWGAIGLFWVLLLGGGAYSVLLLIRRTSVRLASVSLGLKLLALTAIGVASQPSSADCFGGSLVPIAAAAVFVAVGAVLDSDLVLGYGS